MYPSCTSECKVYAACRLSVCLRRLAATFSCVQPADNQAEHKQQAGRLHPWIYLAVIEYCSMIMIERNKVKGYLTAF